MERIKFIVKVVGIAILATGFFVSLGIIISNQYGVENAPAILLSTVNVIALLALAFFTHSYMKSTRDMANEMKATREMEFEINHRPKVTLEFEAKSDDRLYLVVKNEGNGAARNVKFNIRPPLKNPSGHTIDNWPALKNGIPYFPPNKKLAFSFDRASIIPYYDDKGLAKDFIAKVKYDWNVKGKPKIHEKCPLELSSLMQTDLSSYKDIGTLINEVEKLTKALTQNAPRWSPEKQRG